MSTFKFTVIILLTTLLMGFSFAVVKIGLPYSSPLLLAALRFLLAGIIMGIIVFALNRPHPTTTSD
ncbi:EamA family transporter [Paenibacillus arenosi]|uniref:EamA family transporter n=1 Tax=Paenibacillus arenosi TaxID=2774142 RepID=UPI001CDC112B|nr:EamA family transporter [Paenibacillus arenosi]